MSEEQKVTTQLLDDTYAKLRDATELRSKSTGFRATDIRRTNKKRKHP